MLPVRVATAIVGVPIIIALIWWGGAGFSVAVGVILVIAALEFYAAVDPAPRNASLAENPLAAIAQRPLPRLLNQRPLGLLGAALVALLVAGAHNGIDWWTGALALATVLPLIWLIARGETQRGLNNWLATVGGVLYVGWLGSYLVLLRLLDQDGQWVFLAIFATFANDTGAYFVGMAVGRTPLAPRISPGKTVEGALGGLVCGAAAVPLLSYALGLDVGVGPLVPLAVLVPVAAQLGDLAESLLKRSTGVKDAGVLVPGHGGLLDRLDSLLFVVPMVYYYAIWVVL
jgi:phosphatidate cytidylyltransferase